jgi:hypothetical protein
MRGTQREFSYYDTSLLHVFRGYQAVFDCLYHRTFFWRYSDAVHRDTSSALWSLECSDQCYRAENHSTRDDLQSIIYRRSKVSIGTTISDCVVGTAGSLFHCYGDRRFPNYSRMEAHSRNLWIDRFTSKAMAYFLFTCYKTSMS